MTQQNRPFCSHSIPTGYSTITNVNFRVHQLDQSAPQTDRLELLEKIEYVLKTQRNPEPDDNKSAQLFNELTNRVDELRVPISWPEYIVSFVYTTDHQTQCEQAYLRIKSFLQNPLHG